MNKTGLTDLATTLVDAEATARPVDQLTSSTCLSLVEAYAVQLVGVDLKVGAGDRVVGLKLGFTSREKAHQMGVHDVILGVLTAAGDLGNGPEVSLEALIHPRIEPEVAFLLDPGVGELDLADPSVSLLDHVTHVAVGAELIDSRYREFRFTLEDVVADNTSAARFRVGEWLPFAELRDRLGDLPVTLTADGETVGAGSTRAILGDPLAALAAVQRLAAAYGHAMPPSAVVLAGAATAAVPMVPGVRYEAQVDLLGSVSVQASGPAARAARPGWSHSTEHRD
jgi:2-oxo-3-hexenedioate decarboxylase